LDPGGIKVLGNVVLRRKPQSTFLWVWGLCFTQIYISGFLLFGPWWYWKIEYRGHLKLC